MLKLQSVHTSYGHIMALKGIDIEILAGELVSLIGSNGSGKTTTLMTISGILKPASGDILFEGRSIKHLPPHEIVKMGICHVPEGRRIFQGLTVSENLEIGAFLNKQDYQRNLEMAFELFPLLKDRRSQIGGTLSGGEQQMLAIARALMSKPRLLLLDEPSLGLAPIMVSKIFRTIKEINLEGVTVLLVEQNAKAALRLAMRGYVLENGKVTLQGGGEELLQNEDVKKAYLGE